jgi:Pentapeptide repeats (8 copies)
VAQKKKSPKTALDPSFSARKPISAWNRPLQLDAKGLFGALGKAALHGFTGQWTEFGGDTVDGLAALGLDSRDASQLSWLLLRRSLLSAMAELIRESLPEIGDSKKDLKEVSQRLDEALEDEEVAIDRSLFDRPRDLPLLGIVQEPFTRWLEAYGLEPPAAASVAGRLPSYFVLALHNEWRSSPATYDPIGKAVDTPFTRAAERERAWDVYAARLERQVDEPMFGESFGLRQVYVPLRAFYTVAPPRDRLSEGRGTGIEHAEKQERHVAVRFEEEIDTWVAAADKRDSYRVLSGGPGSGKSSFLRMYAARAAREKRIRVLFIPLHQLNVSSSLVAAVGDYVRLAEVLPGNPLDPDSGEDRLLLLLDGLDELAMQGRIGAEAARDFVREVLTHVGIRNQDRCRLLVVFSGREPVIQASESEFRERRRVLHALPYFIEESRRKDQAWKDSAEILAEDQRPSWWEAYGKASGRGYTTLPADLKREDLDEVTAQPLLNYLVALSYDRGRLSFSDELNLNDIYLDLLDAVHERGYEQRRSLAPSLSLLEFRRVLEEIALSAWHGSGRTTSVAEIQAHCQAAGVSGLLERFKEGAKAGVTRVLTAFYFRQFGQTATGDPTFEFTHKSFREYLTALRIIDALELIQDEMDRRQRKPGAGWDEATALKHWAEICGPTQMDWELWVFVDRDIRRRGKKTARAWQKMLCGLISSMLRSGMPMELLSPRPSFHEESRQARNAEEALLAVLNACARTTRELSHIDWPQAEDGPSGRTAFGTWLKRIQGQRTDVNNVLFLQCLSYLDLKEQILPTADLSAADLRETDLQGTHLGLANLNEANLQKANLKGSYLGNIVSKGYFLKRHFRQRRFERGTNLEGANLEGANLEGARLISQDQLKGIIGTFIGKPHFFVDPSPSPEPRS